MSFQTYQTPDLATRTLRVAVRTCQGPVALRIHSIVQQHPGIHFRELGRAADLHSTGQLRHHLDRLARRNMVCEVADGRYRRYFPSGHGADLQPQLSRLSRALPRRIVRLLLAAPMSRTAMRRQLGCADSTLGYHLQRMLRQGDLQQRRVAQGSQYLLADPDRIRRVLMAQEAVLEEGPISDLTAPGPAFGIEAQPDEIPGILELLAVGSGPA